MWRGQEHASRRRVSCYVVPHETVIHAVLTVLLASILSDTCRNGSHPLHIYDIGNMRVICFITHALIVLDFMTGP